MAGQLQPLRQIDFSGGVNLVASPYLITPKQVSRIRNMILDEHGSLSSRDGSHVLHTSPDVTSPIVHIGVLNTVSGTAYPFALQNDGNRNTLYRTDTTPWSVVGTTTTAGLTPDSITVTDKQVFALGYETPRLWDGSTLSLMTASGPGTQFLPPGAQHIAFHLASVWLWNTSPITTALDGPSSIRMSDANNPNSWPSANQAFIAKDDGQQGMGLSAYTIAETGISPTATLVAFKNLSAYQINGVFGASNFSVQRIKSDMGCIAPRSIQFVSGFGIIRLTHKGFALYDGVNDRLISEEVRPAIFGHDAPDPVVGLNFTTIASAWATQSQNPPLYICAAPTSGRQLDRVFVYDLIRKAWTICDYPFAIHTLALVFTPTTQPVVTAGATGGTLRRLFARDHDDDGADIPWSVRLRPAFVSSPQSHTYFRRVVLDFSIHRETLPQTVTVSTVYADADPTLTTLTFDDSSTGGRWGAARWGAFTWGAGEHVDSRRTVDLQRTSPSCFLDVAGAGHCILRGVTWQARSKPLTRVGR